MAIMLKRSHIHAATLFFFIIYYLQSYSHAGDSITQGQQLVEWNNLVSARGIFNLGFFSPYHSSRTRSRYLGIWLFKEEPYQLHPVWIANRGNPIPGDLTRVLTIDDDGNLNITYGGGSGNSSMVLNLNSTRATTNNVTVTLLDSGNLVLREPNGTGGLRLLWQSFDHPTDTLLPGMKLGVDLKTGQRLSLTSWLSDQVPYSGAFTLDVDHNDTNQLVISRRGEVYWRSGVWNGSNFDNLKGGFLTADYGFVSNKDEKYFNYSAAEGDFSSVLAWRLTWSGQLRLLQWDTNKGGDTYANELSSIQCQNTERYFPSIISLGCVAFKTSVCRSGHEQFVSKDYAAMEGNISSVKYDRNLGLSDCDTQCRSNCSCVAYADANGDGTGCKFWDRGSKFLGEDYHGSSDAIRELYILSSLLPQERKWWIWFLIAIGISIPIVFTSYLRRESVKLKGEKTNQEKKVLESGTRPPHKFGTDADMLERQVKEGHELIFFKFDRIMAATDNFSCVNKLGEGGFGPVYKGKLQERQEIAVKRLSKSSGQGLKEFKNEIALIAKLQHTNLVRLLGCCSEGEEMMLIYEYMPNKSLDSFLFDPTGRKLLDWRKRINIIEGIAQGLLYLHKYSRLRVIHRDLKVSNILLDEEMNPKISDFGMARIFGLTESEANTKRIVGTYGYMSPEYAMDGIFSVKSDVFSFGVLLLEILSGKKNTNFNNNNFPINLVGCAWELWQKDAGIELMDPLLDTSCPREKMLRCIHIGLLCVQKGATDRPTMSDVVSMFTNETMSLLAPKQPAFFFGRSVVGSNSLENKSESCSLNDLTISVMEVR